MLKAASFTPRTAFPKAANIFNKPRTGCSVTNPWNGADFVTQNSGKVLFGICLQLNNYIVGPNYLSYNPSRNGMQPLKHFWILSGSTLIKTYAFTDIGDLSLCIF